MDFTPPSPPSKAERHSARRLKERYGEDFTPELKARIVREIKRGMREIAQGRLENRKPERNAKRLPRPATARRVRGHHHDRTQQWAVTLDGTLYRLIYDRISRVIVTFLPPRDE